MVKFWTPNLKGGVFDSHMEIDFSMLNFQADGVKNFLNPNHDYCVTKPGYLSDKADPRPQIVSTI